jgi:hypothetical protein
MGARLLSKQGVSLSPLCTFFEQLALGASIDDGMMNIVIGIESSHLANH